MSKLNIRILGLIAVAAATLPSVGNAGEIDWGKVKGLDITVFYPGQSSWEWILTQSDHEGAKDLRKGKKCWDCHEAEEMDIGAKIASGKKLEPNPIAGKRPAFNVNVKAANDGQNLYVRLAWPDGGSKVQNKEDPKFEEKATILIGDDSQVAFKRGGCWSVCHDDLIDMPSAGNMKLEKYLAESRTKITRQGGGEGYKSDQELADLLANGTFVELWQARLNRDSISAVDGYILEKIHENDHPDISVTGGLQDGEWVVVFSRKLIDKGAGRKSFKPGEIMHFGIAIHDDYAAHRHHNVSFGRTLSIDSGDADIVAEKQ